MSGFIKRAIERRIRRLRLERDGMVKNRDFYPPGSFGAARVNLGIEMWELKITLWQSFL